jgi:exo-beta-1,3-glucanase (GH17 family)
MPRVPVCLRGSPKHNRQVSRRTGPIFFRVPLGLLLISLGVIAAAWWWLATPVTLARAPIDPAAKLYCVSYAPFRGNQTPMNPELIVSPEQIQEDLVELAKISQCVRTYSVDNGLDKVPELASRVGLKVLLGVWIGNEPRKNTLLADTAIALAKAYPDTVQAIIVGNEVLLRGEMTPSDLRAIIRSVKARVNIPVTYADVWEYWLRYREVAADVDFVTIHVLPYWENMPVRAEDAAAHVVAIQKQVALVFPGKEILIGETGWPSNGRMREGALPSRTNQARIVSEMLDLAKRENFRVNLIEAYDALWKREWEGTVGGNWGLFDGAYRRLKYPAGLAISNYPFWKLQMAGGMALAGLVFAAAGLALRRRPGNPRLASWIAVGISATTAGILLGVAADKMFYESYGIGRLLGWGSLLAAAIASPLLCANALMSGRALPTFLQLIGPREGRTLSVPTMVLGLALTVTTLLAAETALGLLFDPRWRDFPFASLTMAVVPFGTLALFNRPTSGVRPIAETAFAALFAATALYAAFNEGFDNWQSLWTCAAYLLLGITLWRARSATVAETISTIPLVASEAGLSRRKSGGTETDRSRNHAENDVVAPL